MIVRRYRWILLIAGTLALSSTVAAQSQKCPDHASLVPSLENAKHYYCKCDAGFKPVGNACLPDVAAKPQCPAGSEMRGGECVNLREPSIQCTGLKEQIGVMRGVASRGAIARDVYLFFDEDNTKGWLDPRKAPPPYTMLSNQIDELRKMFPGKQPSEIQALIAPDGSGYRAAIYRDTRTNELVVTFRGTIPTRADDWGANIPNEFGLPTTYYNKAQELARAMQQYAQQNKMRLEFVGHSLGGGMAIAASSVAGARATVFNPTTVHNTALSGATVSQAGQLVSIYSTPGEIVTGGQHLVMMDAPGKMTKLPEWPGAPSAAHPIDRHAMTNVRQAIREQQRLLQEDFDKNKCPR